MIPLSRWTESSVREMLSKSHDVAVETCIFGPPGTTHRVVLIYAKGLINNQTLEEVVLPYLRDMLDQAITVDPVLLERNQRLMLRPVAADQTTESVMADLFSGYLIVFLETSGLIYTLNICNLPNRNPEESSSEVSIKGPRDSFTESIGVNVALVRKRLKSNSMKCEVYSVGRRSKTSVALLYIDDVIDPDLVDDARQKLQAIDVDGLVSSSQLEEGLTGSSLSLFPLLDYTGRPDFVADSLLRGRMGIMVDGSPMALLGPANLVYIMKSPEDVHFPYYYVAMERILRIVGLLVAIFLPGFYIAVTAFNLDQIPFPLLATISSLRIGLPLSGPMDFFIMLGLFELFREAGMRLPKAVGQTVAVVGGLIVGDAAIRAGITGPATLVAVAISTMAMFTLVNQSLSGAVTLLRIIILLVSTVLGMFGFILSVVALTLYLATLETFGVSYLAPLSPPRYRELVQAILAKPFALMKRRPSFLKPVDRTRRGGDAS
ncbi:spore germination protein [Paenibacillus sp. GCM10012303]|uniref:spore germination protein n=1 Tax=Paenibacillus sp. GCM10012303 TaxID=3317340 RepID=UPI003612E278